jgi:hypothetical protein
LGAGDKGPARDLSRPMLLVLIGLLLIAAARQFG